MLFESVRLGSGIDIALAETGDLQHDLPKMLVAVGEVARDAKSGVLLGPYGRECMPDERPIRENVLASYP